MQQLMQGIAIDLNNGSKETAADSTQFSYREKLRQADEVQKESLDCFIDISFLKSAEKIGLDLVAADVKCDQHQLTLISVNPDKMDLGLYPGGPERNLKMERQKGESFFTELVSLPSHGLIHAIPLLPLI